MDKTLKLFIGIILLVAVVLLVGMFVKNRSNTRVSNLDSIKIGAILPLTGKASNFGEELKNGIEMAVSDYNDWGGDLTVIYEDELCDPKTALSAFNKFIEVDKVSVVIGAFCSSSTLAIAPVAEKNQILLITPGSAAETISQSGDFVFRNHDKSSLGAFGLGRFLGEKENKVVIFFDVTNDATVLAKEYLEQGINDSGGEVVRMVGFTGGQISYLTDILKNMEDIKKSDVIHVEALTKDAVIFVKQLSELGIKKQLSFDNIVASEEFLNPLGELAEGVLFAATQTSLGEDSGFFDLYKDRYGVAPTVFSVQAYDTVMMLGTLFKNCGIDAPCLRDNLYSINYQGVGGLIEFDENGDVFKNTVVKTVKDGKVINYE